MGSRLGRSAGEGSVSRVCGVGGVRGSVMATTAMRLAFALRSNPGLSSFLGQPWACGLNAVGVGSTSARAVALAARVGIGIGIAIGIENAEEHWVCSRTRTRTRTPSRTRSRSGPPWNCHVQEGGWELVSGDWDLVTRRVRARGLQGSGVWKLTSGIFPCAAWGHAAFKGSFPNARSQFPVWVRQIAAAGCWRTGVGLRSGNTRLRWGVFGCSLRAPERKKETA